MMSCYDAWKSTDTSYAGDESPACPCCEPGFAAAFCPICDACECGCGAIGDEPCEREARAMGVRDTIPAPPFEDVFSAA